jgi:hypothetical protein
VVGPATDSADVDHIDDFFVTADGNGFTQLDASARRDPIHN